MKKLFQEFKKFISRGSVIDLAVGVIIGGAFTSIVNALVNNIFMPLIGSITRNSLDSWVTILPWATKLSANQNPSEATGTLFQGKYYDSLSYINWGSFIEAVINFLLIAVVLFIIVKIINAARDEGNKAKLKAIEKIKKRNEIRKRKGLPEEPLPVVESVPAPKPIDPQIELLTEIRDLLKENNSDSAVQQDKSKS